MKKRDYLTNILSDEHKWWKPGSKVFISAQPGAGKTTYILRVLLKFAIDNGLEILYLSNRETLHKQLMREVCKLFNIPFEYFKDEKFAEFPGITLTTYQTIAEMLSTDHFYSNIPFYQYVVMDEAHFFMEDSDFNAKIQRLVRWRERIKCAVEIYISATLEDVLIEFDFWHTEWQMVYNDDILEVRERKAHDIVRNLKGEAEMMFYYHIPFEFSKCNIFVYDDVADVVEMINADKSEDKWLLFQSNKETARRIATKEIKVKTAIITADDKECDAMQEIVENQSFKEKVLITTKVLDNGVSLHDSKIKNILIETTSKTEFIQMMGRRRMENDEEIVLNLYIPRWSDRYFKSLLIRRINPLLELTILSQERLMTIMMDSDTGYKAVKSLYDAREGRLVLNPIAEKRLHKKEKYYRKISQMMEADRNAYVYEQLSWIGVEDFSEISFLSEIKLAKKLEKLISMLEEVLNEELDKERQRILRANLRLYFHELLPERFPHTSRMPGLTVINECLETLELPYLVSSIPGKKKGDETIWKLVKNGLATSV